MIPIDLHPDRLFPADPSTRQLARALYATVRDLPIVSPHGHTDPQWYADNAPFADASALFIVPDHYVFRMLYSQGVALEALGVPTRPGAAAGTERPYNPRAIWRAVRAALSALPRHADAAVARPRVPHRVRDRRAPDVRKRRPLLRPHQRMPCRRRVSSACAVRAVQHRSHRHDGVAARSAVASSGDSLERLDRTGRDHLSTGSGSRPGVREFRGQCRAVRRNDGRGYCDLARVPGRTSHAAGILQVDGRDVDRSRPSDGAHARSRRGANASGFSIARCRERSPRTTPRRFARRC